ncbi:MAG TPA: type I-E CRISPR-associated endoribonuclease Cas2 [Acholeplasmatales bacterium]|nr:type I-E CRISPR-associated endoribonuclease Cas2 [Acholeplasmatales bacterium]
MIVIITENALPKIRGELTRWLLEAKPGVFVGDVSASVREKLWEKIVNEIPRLGALMFFSAQTEQGFAMRMNGYPKRQVVDIEGIQLITTKS